ncbi:MAG TPA: transketolase [Pirellulales bacterium]|jgi:transketolase|nr:transketolase [Pirellulales bacterium]
MTIDIDQLSINTIRTLAIDAVQAANSGHPGTPMALAPVAYTLFNRVLRFDPDHPHWPARDRFVLSCGHASMLLYATLHLAGVKQAGADGRPTDQPAISLDEIKRFRRLHSRCAGHPEHGEASGIETTTGPLGQGAGNSVGMAIAQRWLAAHFHRPAFELFDYNVYALASDGDLMEGVSAEAASLAGHLKLANLCWIYDDNKITIEGQTKLAFSEDVARRFEGYCWHVIQIADVNDLAALDRAYAEFHATADRPTLLIVKSHIGYGAPHKQDTHHAHGSPLGDDEIKLTKQAYGWPENEKFLVPPEVPAHFVAGIGARGRRLFADWQAKLADYAWQFPDLAEQLLLIEARELPKGWDAGIASFPADAKGLATRVSSGKVLNAIAPRLPWLVGGAADLAPSTMTLFDTVDDFEAETPAGRNLHFGIREHAMMAAVNGMVLSGLRAFGATFFVFSDYCKPSIRLSAIMRIPSLFIFTHDSIGVGEDGPTHQPVEHLAALRAIPGLVTLRPGDANEVAEAYRTVLPWKNRPAALILTRQNLPTIDRAKYASATGVARGAYVLADAADGEPELILIGTGSELCFCVEAFEKLTAEGVKARLVSMPSWELFEEQPAAYKGSVLPPAVTARLAVEAGVEQGWQRYLGAGGRFLGMTGFGASAPYGALAKHFGFTAENVVKLAHEVLAGR